MRKHFLLLLWLTLLPLAGWAQTVNWKTGGTSKEVNYTGEVFDLSTLIDVFGTGSSDNVMCEYTNPYTWDQAGTNGSGYANCNRWNYSVHATNAAASSSTGATVVPQEVGTYYVRVWARYQNNSALANAQGYKVLTLTIKKQQAPVTGLSLATGLIYNDGALSLVSGTPTYPADYQVTTGGIEYIVKDADVMPAATDAGTEAAEETNAGTYFVFARVKGDTKLYDTGDWYKIGTTGVTISRREITAADFTFSAVDDELVYNTSAQNLNKAIAWTGDIARGTVQYAVSGGSFADALATGTDADTYTVQVQITPNDNHLVNGGTVAGIIASTDITKEIKPATPEITTDPAEIANLVYDGTALALITAGVSTAGTDIYYQVGTDAFAAAVPTATNAGTYTVNYYVKSSDTNYTDLGSETEPAGTITVIIDKAQYTVNQTLADAAVVYNGAEQSILKGEIHKGTGMPGGTVKFTIGEEVFGPQASSNPSFVKETNAGTYEVAWEAYPADAALAENYYPAKGTLTATISRAKLHMGAQGKNVPYNTAVSYYDLIQFDNAEMAAFETLTVEELKDLLVTFVSFEGGTIEAGKPTVLPTDAGEWDFVLGKNDDGTNYELVNFIPEGTLTITKIDATAATVAAATLEYDGTDQALLDVDDTAMEGGKMLYWLAEEGQTAPTAAGDTKWSEDIPTAKNAGDYTVYYMMAGDNNHNDILPVEQVDVNIAQKPLDIAMFTFSDDDMKAEFTGDNLMPTFTAADGDPSALVDADFTVAKTNSVPEAVTEMVNVDTYTFTFTAAAEGNYTGTVTADFEITPKPIDADDVEFALATESVEYDGADHKADVVVNPTAPLTADDYDVATPAEMVNAGEYTITLNAKGNYSGSTTTKFTITQKALTPEMFTLSSTEEIYDGSNLMPDFTFADGDPSALAATDFTVATTNSKPEAVTEMIDADTYTFTFTAAADGNYKGEVTATFVIAQDEAEFVLAKANNLTYNGYDQALVTEAETDAVDGKVEYQILSGEEVVVDWTEDFAAVVAKNAGDYTVKTKFTASDINYTNPEVFETVDVTINIATIGYSLSNLTKDWDGELFAEEEISKLFTLSAGGDGTKLFGDDEYDKPFTLKLPEDYRDAGTYTFKQPKVEFKEGYPVNYNVTFNGTAEVIINKVDLVEGTDYTAPGAIGGLVYTPGVEQALVTDGSLLTEYAEDYPNKEIAGLPYGGTILFATAEDGEYSETVPTGTEAKDYEVWFKVAGDINHNETKPVKIENTIAPALLTADFLPETYETELPYKAAKYEPTDFIPALDGIDLDEGYEVFAPELKDAGEYVILFQGINNYAGEDSKFEVTVKITPIDVIAIAPKGVTKVYDGTASLEGVVKNGDISFVGVLSGDKITLPEDLALTTEGIAASDKPYAIKVDAAAINDLNNNYNVLDESIDGEVTINKAPAFKVGFATVPATWTKVFGEEDPELTGFVLATDGFFGNIDDLVAATTAERAEGEDVGEYDVTLTFDETAEVFANYEGVEFDGVAATFTITQSDKVYTVSLANVTKTYTGEEFDTAIEFTADDLVIAGYEGDKAKFFDAEGLPTAAIAAGAKNAGDYNITLEGGASTNFKFTFVPATFTIAPFEVTEATIEAQKVQKGKELDVTKFTITAPTPILKDEDGNEIEVFYVTAPGLVNMDDIVTGDAGVYEDGLVIAVDESVADNYVGLDKFTAELEIIAAEAIVLADNEDFESEAQEGVDVTFASRKLNAGNWNVIALPFEASVAQISDAFGYAAVDVLTEENANPEEIHFHIISSGTVPAYTPFIVKTTEDEGLKKTDFDQVVFHNVNIEAMSPAANKAISDAAGNKFIGTFKAETKFWGEKYRYMAGGAWYNAKNFTESNPAIVKAFRGYIEMVSASARIFIEEPDGTVTAIDAVNFNKAAAEGMYNLSGMKINNTNRKSVVIENGKKVIK